MSEVNKIIKDLEFCDSVFDYTLAPDDCGLLLGYIVELQQENQQLKEDYNKVVHETTEWEDRYYRLQDKWDISIIKLEHENKILKSVLDEIRERIEFFIEDGRGSLLELLEILDKVKI